MDEAKEPERYEATVVPIGNSRGMRLPAGFFAAHPEFTGKVRVTVVADGAVLLSPQKMPRRRLKDDEADPVVAGFLQFMEGQMTAHPDDIVAADAQQLRRIGKLIEGVDTTYRRPINVNGWSLYYHRVFKASLDELEAVVTQLAAADPAGYKSHPKTKLLASVYRAITQLVPANPDAPDFRLGKTMGSEYTHWRRVKKGMPDRYRLFFRFASTPVKVIVYVWFNDEDALRKAGAKTDVYEAFKRMLARGVVPTDIDALLVEATQAS